jgi:hypothetical protein
MPQTQTPPITSYRFCCRRCAYIATARREQQAIRNLAAHLVAVAEGAIQAHAQKEAA